MQSKLSKVFNTAAAIVGILTLPSAIALLYAGVHFGNQAEENYFLSQKPEIQPAQCRIVDTPVRNSRGTLDQNTYDYDRGAVILLTNFDMRPPYQQSQVVSMGSLPVGSKTRERVKTLYKMLPASAKCPPP